MKILMSTAEAVPFAKAGGLGDVISALSTELAALGHDVRILLPFYRSAREHFWQLPESERRRHNTPFRLHLPYGPYCLLWEWHPQPGLRYYFLEYDAFFGRDAIYGDYRDNPHRFALLSRATIDLTYFLHWHPDIFHVHDWMSALAPVYLETTDRQGPLAHSASVLTIHNLQHQGLAHRSLLDFSGLPQDLFRADKLEACGMVNFLKGGLYFANKITTVSPTYSREIQTAPHGCGQQDLLKFRAGDLIGILNGIDTRLWNPATDPHLPVNFTSHSLEGKRECKRQLLDFCQLGPLDAPLFGIISRLYSQKGLDLLAHILPYLLDSMAGNYVLLGSGDQQLENVFRDLAWRYPHRIFCHFGYHEELAHRIEGGSDFFLMPSRFEPCGLNQMYSMRYGTLPIVHATGGLRDSVENYDETNGTGTGFCFRDLTANSLYNTIGWAQATYYNRPETLHQMRIQAMNRDFSWQESARRYEDVYRWAREKKC